MSILKGNSSVAARHLRARTEQPGEVQGWVASIIDLSQKRAEDRIAADLRAMTLLQEVGSECVREGLTTNQCLNLALKAAIEIVGAKKGTLQLFETISGALVIAVQHRFEEPFLIL